MFTLFDMYGNKVLEQELNKIQNIHVIDLEQLASGIYSYSIKTSQNSYLGKITIGK